MRVGPLDALAPYTAMVLEQLAEDYAGEQLAPPKPVDPIFALQGQPKLVAIAQNDKALALTLHQLIDELVEGDFGTAAFTADKLSHRIRTAYLATLSDERGVVR